MKVIITGSRFFTCAEAIHRHMAALKRGLECERFGAQGQYLTDREMEV